MKKVFTCTILILFILLNINLTSKFGRADSSYWYRVWGGEGHDECTAIALDSSENIYLAGSIKSFGVGHSAICLVKFNNAGNYQWNKTFGGNASDLGMAIAIDSADNIFLAGRIYNYNYSNYDFVLIKYDSSGNYQWNKTWDSGVDDWCYTMILDSLENIYLAGSSYIEPNNEDFCLVKFDHLGNFMWNRTWGGSYNDRYIAIAIDTSDNVFLLGDTESFGAGNYAMCLVNYNNTGNLQWYTIWSGSEGDFSGAIVLDHLENIYIVGTSYKAGFSDCSLVAFDKLGNYQWNKTWGSENTYEGCHSVLIDSGGNLYLAGTKSDQYCIVVYNTNGTFQRTKSQKIYHVGVVTGMVQDTKGNIYIGGIVYTNGANEHEFLLIKNLHLFPEQQISGYYPIFLVIAIGMFSSGIILKTKTSNNKKSKI
ncbi:MAG: hypothetical protein ACFFKA_13450 [Candidatus Thorarchaeota archaeon]